MVGSLLCESKLGLRNTLLLTSALVTLGGAILSVSAIWGTYWLGLVGRITCGVGIES